MPTMAKLFAAILFAVLGYFVADLVGGHLPPEERQGMLRPMSAFFGLLVGWKFLGRRVVGDYSSAIGLGLSSGLVLLLVGLIFFSGLDMVDQAMDLKYGGNPFKAVEDMFAIALRMLNDYVLKSDVVIALAAGSIVVGFVVKGVSRIWS